MSSESLRILIVGDFAPINRVAAMIKRRDYCGIFNDILPIVKSADIAVANLELPLVNEGIPAKKTGPHMRAIPESIRALKYAGFNLLTLANNHIMDYGAGGLISTLELCKNNEIETLGAGMNLGEAKRTHYIDNNGIRIAFLNAAENEWGTTRGEQAGANPLDCISLSYQISEAKRNAEVVILLVHGGHEGLDLPSPEMKKVYRFFVDSGADAVIGHHTHCFSGLEVYRDKLIVYSLGNFIFDKKQSVSSDLWNIGCGVTLEVSGEGISHEVHPFRQCDERVGVRLFDQQERREFEMLVEEKTSVIKDDEELGRRFREFLEKRRVMYEGFLEPVKNRILRAAMRRGVLPRLVSGKHRRLLLNLMRCESHREALVRLLAEGEGE